MLFSIISFILVLLPFVSTLIFGVLAYVNYKYGYWARIGIPSFKPTFPRGSMPDPSRGKLSTSEVTQHFYRRAKRNGYRHAGLYSFLNPVYMPVDPTIIKSILQKDFQHFVNHGITVNEEHDPLQAHLFNLEDDKWRRMRVKLTPTFTSGKMKMMFQTMLDCTVGLKDIMDDASENRKVLDIKDILARFTTDIIGSVAFGIECNSLRDPNAEFRKYGAKTFEVDEKNLRKRRLQMLLPKFVMKMVKYKVTKPDVEEFFMKAIGDTVDYREKNNVTRKDFMQMLIQLKNKGFVADDDKTADYKKTDDRLSMKEVAAQAFVFFLAGFETSSTTMTFALVEIASNPEIQEKLRQEIGIVLARHGDELSYTAVMEMTYLEKCIQEVLRKYPPVGSLPRICTKDYSIPNSDITLEKGTRVTIPVLGLHRDPDIYPDPEKFDPERFSEQNKKTRPECTWLPFGDGPRQCIGLRFGMLQTRVGLITLLKDYEIKLSQKTRVPIKFESKALISSVEGGVWLEVEKIR